MCGMHLHILVRDHLLNPSAMPVTLFQGWHAALNAHLRPMTRRKRLKDMQAVKGQGRLFWIVQCAGKYDTIQCRNPCCRARSRHHSLSRPWTSSCTVCRNLTKPCPACAPASISARSGSSIRPSKNCLHSSMEVCMKALHEGWKLNIDPNCTTGAGANVKRACSPQQVMILTKIWPPAPVRMQGSRSAPIIFHAAAQQGEGGCHASPCPGLRHSVAQQAALRARRRISS